MTGARDVLAVCLACLRARPDISADWIRIASEGRERTTYYCRDDFAFPARKPVHGPSSCPHCRDCSAVIAVDPDVADGIARFLETP